jgi:predicted acetyltransferase
MTKIQECMMIKAEARKSLWNPIKGQRKKISIVIDGVVQPYKQSKHIKIRMMIAASK